MLLDSSFDLHKAFLGDHDYCKLYDLFIHCVWHLVVSLLSVMIVEPSPHEVVRKGASFILHFSQKSLRGFSVGNFPFVFQDNPKMKQQIGARCAMV